MGSNTTRSAKARVGGSISILARARVARGNSLLVGAQVSVLGGSGSVGGAWSVSDGGREGAVASVVVIH